MYLVRDQRTGYLVFMHEDPRNDGYSGEVEIDTRLDYPLDVHEWPDGVARPEIVVGVRGPDRREYRVFRYDKDRRQAGYKLVPGTPLVYRTWLDYTRRLIWDESLQGLPKWVEIDRGAIPAWNTLPDSERKQVIERLEFLRRLPPKNWAEDEARQLKAAEGTYLARVNPSLLLLFLFRAEDGGQFVIENFIRQETLDRYFVPSKAPAARS
jgi:hypothetical protein